MKRLVVLFLAVCASLVSFADDSVKDQTAELERMVVELERMARGNGPDALRAKEVLRELNDLERVRREGERASRRSLAVGREQLDEFMKCRAMSVLTPAQRKDVAKFSETVDAVIAGKDSQEVLARFFRPKTPARQRYTVRKIPLQRGDILLVRNGGIWSDLLVDASQREKRFSHAEIAQSPTRLVSVGVDEKTGRNAVSLCTLESRLCCAEDLAVYRYLGPESGRVCERIAQEAEKRIGTPFDPAFDLKTKDRLYCTEMVRDCVNAAAGRELIGTSRRGGFEYVAVDDCYGRGLTKVWDSRDASGTRTGHAADAAGAAGTARVPPVKAASATNAPMGRIIFIPRTRRRR